jgi:threonine/homoserine/homoserine lactone efflux protein
MLGTLVGMAPLCFLQAYFAEELFTHFPALLYPLAVVSVLYLAYAGWVISRFRTVSP